MSLAAVQERPPGRPAPIRLPDGITGRGFALSGALHLVLAAVLIVGLPTLFSPPPPQEIPIAVDLVNLGPETRATRPNHAPQHQAKPVEPVPGPAATPSRKPEPPPPPSPSPAASAPVLEPPAEPESRPAPIPPPPLPQAKPEPPRPAETVAAPLPREKPTPPRQSADNGARAQSKKYDPGRFDALLRNLAAANSPSPMPRRPSVAPAGTPSSQPAAPLASRLSASEIDLVREQISRCWNVPAGARDDKDLVVEIRVIVDPDGNVEQATIVDSRRATGNPFYRAAAESARRAFFNPECRPLHLPPDKYEIWRNMVVDFSPKDLS